MLHRTRASWPNTRSLSALTSFTLVITLVHAPAASAALALDPSNAPRERSVAVTSAGTAPLAEDPAEKAALTKPDNVFWPMPGSAVVDLAAARAKAGASRSASATAVRERAGTLPVYIGTPATAMATADAAIAEAPSQVKVDLLGRRGDALLLRLARADAVAKAGNVSLEVDYSTFRSQYGGDWATRLHLIDLGTCAAEKFTSGECEGTPVGDVQQRQRPPARRRQGQRRGRALRGLRAGGRDLGRLRRLLPFAVLDLAGRWPVGRLLVELPDPVPPSLSGPMPELDIAYSSGNVDGRTTGTQQPALVGR